MVFYDFIFYEVCSAEICHYICCAKNRDDAWQKALKFRDKNLKNPKNWGILNDKII